MNENSIEWVGGGKTATLTLSQRKMVSRIEKLSKQYPLVCKITARNGDGSICAHIPASWVKIRPSKKFSQEERDALAGRLPVSAENARFEE